MKIAFTGTCSTGKTTLGERLVRDRRLSSFNLAIVSADARSILTGFGHQSLDRLTQIDLCAFQLQYFVKKLEQEADLANYITDRSFLDIAAYWTQRNGSILPEHEQRYLVGQCQRASARYDLHVYLPFGAIPFVDDGYRATDRTLEESIDRKIQSLLMDWGLKFVKVNQVVIEARVEEVVNAVLTFLK